MNSLKEYYHKYWTSKLWSPEKSELSLNKIDCLDRFVDKTKKVLDLGCGAGYIYIAQNAKSYTGLDISDEAVKKAKQKGLDVRRFDFFGEVPFSDRSFDIVIIFEVLEHLFNPERLLQETHRVLKDEGILILSLPNAFYLRNRWTYFFSGEFKHLVGSPVYKNREWLAPHIRFFSKNSIERLLKVTGFKVIELHPEAYYFFESLCLMGKLLNLRLLSSILKRIDRKIASLHSSLFAAYFLIVARKNQIMKDI